MKAERQFAVYALVVLMIVFTTFLLSLLDFLLLS